MIHPGALGDVVLAVPALRALRADGPVVLVAQPRLGRLLVALDVVDRAEAFDAFKLDALFAGEPLASGHALAGRLRRARRVVCWFGARDPNFVAGLKTLAPDAIVAPPATPPHLVWRHLAATVGAREPDCAPIAVAPDVRERGEALLHAAGWDGVSRFVVVHPGAGSVAKRWPARAFAALIDELDAIPVVHEGPADAEAVAELTGATHRVVVRVTDPPLDALAGMLARASAYVGNDSGVSHLAATVGAGALILFTEALLAWAPWSPTATCLPITAGVRVPAEEQAVRHALRAML